MLTILWDNDGVLVDTERLYFQAYRNVLREVGVELTRDLYIDISLHRGESTLDLAAERGLDGDQIEQLRIQRNQHYADMLRTTPCMIEGVEDVLSELHGQVRMGVVTSSRRDHFDIIHAQSGWMKYFDFVVAREDYPRSKPHPDPYLTALDRHRLSAADCFAIEDSPRGLASATAAGLRCYVLPNELTTQGTFIGAHRILRNVRQVLDEVQQITSL